MSGTVEQYRCLGYRKGETCKINDGGEILVF
jgi:hypothetical protein